MNPCEEMRKWYLDIFQSPDKLKEFYRKQQYEDGLAEMFINSICTLSVPRKLFLDKYKELPPIEGLSPEEKLNMKKHVHETFPGKSPEFKLEAIKIIYTIGTLL